VGGDAPVVLCIACDVAIEYVRNRNRNHWGAALERHGNRNVEVVDDTVMIQIGKAEVRYKNCRTATEDIDQTARRVVLKFATQAQAMLA